MKLLYAILLLLCTPTVFGISFSIDTLVIPSEILKEERVIYCITLDGLQPTDSVSIVYLLDGEYAEYRYKQLQAEHPNKQLIGMGIVNINRNKDMLPAKQPEMFLQFISQELIPKVEQDYLVNNRIIFGHSFAGGFVVNVLLQSPELFDVYIASSPTPIMSFVNPETWADADQGITAEIKFYFSWGTKDMKQVRKWGTKLYDTLAAQNTPHILWKQEIHQDKNHNNADVPALVKGMKFGE